LYCIAAFEEKEKYVPLSVMTPLIIKTGELLTGLKARCPRCWKCDSTYDIVGIDVGLNFLASFCCCKYDP